MFQSCTAQLFFFNQPSYLHILLLFQLLCLLHHQPLSECFSDHLGPPEQLENLLLTINYRMVGQESTRNAGDLGSIPGLGRFPWRRERLPTPVFWPGEFHGLCSLWGHKESDVTFTFQQKSTALGLRWWSSDFHWKSFHWKNLSSNAGDVGLIPGQGTKIPHTAG